MDLTDQRFGRLVAERRGSNKRYRGGGKTTRWWCVCDCGKRSLVATQCLRGGATRSCGCLREETMQANVKWNTKHNRLWRIWRGMLSRSPVREPKVLAIYQGVGTHDPAWDSFEVFQVWAGATGYADGLTLDRIDNDGGYWPTNCRWRSHAQQMRNKSNHFWVEVGGERMILAAAAERFGITGQTIKRRIRDGWPVDLAVQRLGRDDIRAYNRKFAPPES